MRYMVRKIVDDKGVEHFDTFKVKEFETYYEVDAHNNMDAIRQVKSKKDYLQGLDADGFDIELSELVDKNSSIKETWNLDMRLLVILYQKLNAYYQVAGVRTDLEFRTHTNFNLKEVTEKELIEEVLQQIRDLYDVEMVNDMKPEEKSIATTSMFYNLSKLFHGLWW